jgi:hypothetical protein
LLVGHVRTRTRTRTIGRRLEESDREKKTLAKVSEASRFAEMIEPRPSWVKPQRSKIEDEDGDDWKTERRP